MKSIRTEVISTEKLGMARIVEQRFENPDGSVLYLNRDMKENVRSESPVPGPVEEVHVGANRVKVWTKRL